MYELDSIPESLMPFVVQIVDFNPLRLYLRTSTVQEWEEVKKAVSRLSQLSPFSFIELDEGRQLKGVYAKNLRDVLRGEDVEYVRESMARQAQANFEDAYNVLEDEEDL